jgi:hypothetical protein
MKLKIDGEDYEFSVEAAKNAGILKEILPRQIIKIGNKYRSHLSGKIYILSSVGSGLTNLIDINTGSRHIPNPVNVIDIYNISESEFDLMTQGYGFSPVEVEISVK